MYPQGLVHLHGHEFQVCGRDLVVHLPRQSNQDFDRNYKVSELRLGFGVEIPDTRNRIRAVMHGTNVVSAIDDHEWQQLISAAGSKRRNLKIIGER